MVVSAFVAILLPFKLFLFSYAVLGPLHYLTEIGWLRERKFFAHGKAAPWIMTVLAVLTTLGFLGARVDALSGEFTQFLRDHIIHMVLLAFCYAVLTLIISNWKYQVAAFLAVALGIFLINDMPGWAIFGGSMLPTMFHVYVFTGAFILLGALRSRSRAGYASLIVFVLAGIGLVFMPTTWITEGPSAAVEANITESGFSILTRDIFSLISTENFAISAPLAIKIQSLIAFAYTYHYLNWFSKTGIIKWHKVSRTALGIAGTIWIVSVGLYIWDFQVGLMALFFLSLMHVFLEFPLNHRSFGEIGKLLFGNRV